MATATPTPPARDIASLDEQARKDLAIELDRLQQRMPVTDGRLAEQRHWLDADLDTCVPLPGVEHKPLDAAVGPLHQFLTETQQDLEQLQRSLQEPGCGPEAVIDVMHRLAGRTGQLGAGDLRIGGDSAAAAVQEHRDGGHSARQRATRPPYRCFALHSPVRCASTRMRLVMGPCCSPLLSRRSTSRASG